MRPIQFDNRPFGDVDDLFERMNRQFEELRGQWEHFDGGNRGGMPVDVADYDDEVVVTADLPGFDREDVDVTVSDGVLTIKAERDAEDEHAEGEYLRHERRRAAFRRTVRLPDGIDEDAATAEYVNGVLSITFPKREDEADDARHIDIE